MTHDAQKIWNQSEEFIASKKHLVRPKAPPQFLGNGNRLIIEDELLRLIFLFPLYPEVLRNNLLDIRVKQYFAECEADTEEKLQTNLAMSRRDQSDAAFADAAGELKMDLSSFTEVQQEILLTHYLNSPGK